MARLIKPQPVSPDPHAVAVPAAKPRAKKAGPRIKRGLALAGGGPLGAMYEVGVLMALDESLIGLDLNDMDVYVGVSAGSVITAGLANGLKPTDIFQLFIENKATNKSLGALKLEVFLRPRIANTGGVPRPCHRCSCGRCGAASPTLCATALESFAALSRALPTGLFDNDAVRKYLASAFNEPGARMISGSSAQAVFDRHGFGYRRNRCALAAPVWITFPFRVPCRRPPRCRACSRRWKSMDITMLMARSRKP